VIPALDLRGGRVVRLLKGDFGQETVYGDALETAGASAAAGATRLHVVDLDAARGSGDNRGMVSALVNATLLQVQVAGGVRGEADAARWLAAGAAAVVIGTTAVREPERLAAIAAAHPGRVLAALDVRDGRPAVTGWTEVAPLSLAELLGRWSGATLAGVVLTSVERDGTFTGPDLQLLGEVRARTRHPVTYSGGVSSLADLAALRAAGADGAILGRALLDGRFALEEALA